MGYMHPPHIAWPPAIKPGGPAPFVITGHPAHDALNAMGNEAAYVEFEWPAPPAPIQRVGYLYRHLNAIRAKQRAARVTLELQRGWFNG